MAAASMAGRSTSTFARTIFRSTPTRTRTRAGRLSQLPLSNGAVPSNFTLRSQIRIFPATSPSRLVRRELSTLVPVHSAISAACLVSKLPSEVSASIQEVPGKINVECPVRRAEIYRLYDELFVLSNGSHGIFLSYTYLRYFNPSRLYN